MLKAKYEIKEITYLPEDEFIARIKQLVKKAQLDNKYLNLIKNDLTAVMQKEGFKLKQGFIFKVIKNKKQLTGLKDKEIGILISGGNKKLTTEDLAQVDGGFIGVIPYDLLDHRNHK